MKGVFGRLESKMPKRGRLMIARDSGKHERWADAILPADANAGILEEDTNKRPLSVMAIMGAGLFAILALRLFDLQLTNGARHLGLAEGNRIRAKVSRAPRGVIYDRNNVVLARNVASFDLTVIPQQLPKTADGRERLYQSISQLSGIEVARIKDKTESEGLSKNQPILVAAGLEREKALLIDQATEDLGGFSLDVNPIREYLDGGSLSHFLGYSGRVEKKDLAPGSGYLPTDYIGKLGIEKQYEQLLRGVGGSEQTEVDATGRPIRVLAKKPSVPGLSLVLTIDHQLEQKLAESIRKQMERAGSSKAAGVAINPKTGEVLAAVNLPGYDNNLFSKGIKPDDYQRLTSDPAQPLFNKVTQGGYPTGSIIKPLVASTALEEKVITLNTVIEDKGALEITHKYDPNIKYTFRSYEPGGLGPLNLLGAIRMSSNIYFYTIGGGYGNIRGIGVDKLSEYYRKFGLGQKTGIDIPEENSGRVPTPEWKLKATKEPWYLGDTYNISVGQGDLLASPLQMAVAISTVANGGSVVVPRLVKEVKDGSGRAIQQPQAKIVRSGFISPQHLATVREGMRQVVTSGTACCLIEQQVKVPVAGKTGTAESHSGDKRKPHAWFTAFAPYDDPQIVIVVLVENSGEGAEFAAPAVRETLAWFFSR